MSRILYSGGDVSYQDAKAFNDLINEREKIINDTVKHLLEGGTTAVATAVNPVLGASITLLYAVTDNGKATTLEKDTVKLLNSILKQVDSKLPDRALTANDLAMGLIDDVARYNENIKQGGELAERIATRWFGYNYNYSYEERIWPGSERTNTDFCSNPGGLRPEAVQGMMQWEEGGIKSFIPKSAGYKLAEKINAYIADPDNKVSYDDKVLIVKLIDGQCNGESLSFADMDYEQFSRCIDIIDKSMNEINEVGGASVRDVWDEYMLSFREDHSL